MTSKGGCRNVLGGEGGGKQWMEIWVVREAGGPTVWCIATRENGLQALQPCKPRRARWSWLIVAVRLKWRTSKGIIKNGGWDTG